MLWDSKRGWEELLIQQAKTFPCSWWAVLQRWCYWSALSQQKSVYFLCCGHWHCNAAVYATAWTLERDVGQSPAYLLWQPHYCLERDVAVWRVCCPRQRSHVDLPADVCPWFLLSRLTINGITCDLRRLRLWFPLPPLPRVVSPRLSVTTGRIRLLQWA